MTTTGKHTAGPWRASQTHPLGDWVIHAAGIPQQLAYLAASPHVDWPLEANARLIAAAPELLAELKRLRLAYVNLLEIGRDRIVALGGQCDPIDVMEAGDPALRSAAAAIAKAEGGSR